MIQSTPIAVVTGVGPGTGRAVVERLTRGGYKVAMIARDGARLKELASQMNQAYPYPCDLSDPRQTEQCLDRIQQELGSPAVLVHNAVSGNGVFRNFLEIDAADLEVNFQINTLALLRLAQRLAPAMAEQKEGAIVVTGNTSAFRGKENFAAFAPSKAAQRILCESMARHLGPRGVHVAYLTIDAVIDVPWTRKHFHDKDDAFFIKPSAIAEEVWHLLKQDPSSWSFNVEIRPAGEHW